MFLEHKGFATRATFLIDVDGVIREHFLTEPGQARSLADYRAALDQLTSVPA